VPTADVTVDGKHVIFVFPERKKSGNLALQ